MAAKPDYWVQKVQEWYNSEYQGKTGYTKIMEDGIIGQGTCKALVHALQVELGVPTPNGTFGPITIKYFNDRFGDSGIDETVTNEKIIYILQGDFYVRVSIASPLMESMVTMSYRQLPSSDPIRAFPGREWMHAI